MAALEEQPRVIDVPMGDRSEWQIGQGTDVLTTGGLGPCFGIVAFEPLTRTGHLGHFLAGLEGQLELENFVSSVEHSALNMSSVKAWVRGGQMLGELETYEEVEAETIQDRTYVQERLRQIGIVKNNLDVKWLPAGRHWTDIALFCSSGLFLERIIEINSQDLEAA